jgi:sporulation protein YlmC with PRC-barrel domain
MVRRRGDRNDPGAPLFLGSIHPNTNRSERMRKELLGAISALALMAGPAYAQNAADGQQPGQIVPQETLDGQQGQTSLSQADQAGQTPPAGEGQADVQMVPPAGETDGQADVQVIPPEGEADGQADVQVIPPEGETGTQAGTGMTGQQPAGTTNVEDLMGRTVVGSDGEEIGEIEDVILDADSGEARQVVIASGGFLGLGERRIAVEYGELQIEPGADTIQAAGLTQQSIESMPEFEYGENVVSVTRPAGEAGTEVGTQTDTVAE